LKGSLSESDKFKRMDANWPATGQQQEVQQMRRTEEMSTEGLGFLVQTIRLYKKEE
jgi:hypothetical protein